ncbi:MAG TPA: TonB family protein [Verrucomicrobiae bacterium]|nr:TonB family protein [Verrucomicrobiae bacterium]
MSRLQKKCLIASGALHALLLLVVLMTSAFLVKQEEPVDQQVLTFIPDQLVDEALRQPAGAQAAAQPPPVQQTPPPQVEPPPRQQEPPPKVEPKPPEPKPEPVKPRVEPKPEPKPEPKVEPKKVDPPKPKPEPVKKPAPKPIEVSLKTTVRSNEEAIQKQREQKAEAAKKQQAEADRRREEALSRVSSLESRLNKPTVGASSVDFGTVGVSYASYDSWVQKVYWDAWRPPNDLAAGRSIVKVKVVIRRDGTVESATVTGASGTAALDNNIRQLLARVKTMGRPFPEGAKEAKRTYNIDFNLEAKLGSG